MPVFTTGNRLLLFLYTLPDSVHLFDRHIFEMNTAAVRFLFNFIKPFSELMVCSSQGSFGVDAVKPCKIYNTEDQIANAIRVLFEHHRLVVEGSGALSVGGFLKMKDSFKGKKVVLTVCGRNIDLELFKQIVFQ